VLSGSGVEREIITVSIVFFLLFLAVSDGLCSQIVPKYEKICSEIPLSLQTKSPHPIQAVGLSFGAD